MIRCKSGSKRGHTWIATDPTRPWRRECLHGDAVGAIDKQGRIIAQPVQASCR